MLTKYKNVRSKQGVNKPFEKCFYVCGVFRNFFREGASNFDTFSSVVFSGRIVLKHIENKKGSGWFSPKKFFENFDTVVAILVVFKQFSGKFCLNFVPLILSVLPIVMHFVPIFSIVRAWGVRLTCCRKGLKLWKNSIYQKHVRKWLVRGMHPPWIRPWSLIVMKRLPHKKQINGYVITRAR